MGVLEVSKQGCKIGTEGVETLHSALGEGRPKIPDGGFNFERIRRKPQTLPARETP
jgi:hypothetical protein